MSFLKKIRSIHRIKTFHDVATHYKIHRKSLEGLLDDPLDCGYYVVDDKGHPYYRTILADDGCGIPTKIGKVPLKTLKSRLIKFLKKPDYMTHKPYYLSVKRIPQSVLDYQHNIVIRQEALNDYISHMSPNQFRYFQRKYPKIKEIRPSKVCDDCLDLIMPHKPNYMLGANMSDTQPYDVDWVDPDDRTHIVSVCDGESINDALNNFMIYLKW